MGFNIQLELSGTSQGSSTDDEGDNGQGVPDVQQSSIADIPRMIQDQVCLPLQTPVF